MRLLSIILYYRSETFEGPIVKIKNRYLSLFNMDVLQESIMGIPQDRSGDWDRCASHMPSSARPYFFLVTSIFHNFFVPHQRTINSSIQQNTPLFVNALLSSPSIAGDSLILASSRTVDLLCCHHSKHSHHHKPQYQIR